MKIQFDHSCFNGLNPDEQLIKKTTTEDSLKKITHQNIMLALRKHNGVIIVQYDCFECFIYKISGYSKIEKKVLLSNGENSL